MARIYKSWKVTFKDLKEINSLLTRAENQVNAAFLSLTEDVGFSESYARDLLPTISQYSTATVSQLQSAFTNRREFEREKSYLNRIIKAGEGAPRKGVVSIAPDNANQLTSFYTENGQIVESQFMRKERSLISRLETQKAVKEYKELGVEFVKTPVLNPDTGKPMYDENRHKIYTYVPKTPAMQAKYESILEKRPSLIVGSEDLPKDVHVDMWGDIVPLRGHRKRKKTSKEIARNVFSDTLLAESTQRYFDNYKDIIETVLPSSVTKRITPYLDKISSLSPDKQYKVYRIINDNENVVGTLDFLYWESGLDLARSMIDIIDFWQDNFSEDFNIPSEQLSVETIEQELVAFGYDVEDFNPIFAEYNERKTHHRS